jgi:arsenate reductase-like glutaredoxin family protein
MEARGVKVKEQVSASAKLGATEARKLIRDAGKIYIAKGKKLDEFDGGKATKEILEKMLGTTGNLRAPTVKAGKKLLVGFNEDVYGKVFG